MTIFCKDHAQGFSDQDVHWCTACNAYVLEAFNHKLTPAEHELLTKLSEEAAEVIHMVMKNFLYGLLEVNELNPGGPNNLQRLEKEIGDFSCIVGLLVEKGVLSPAEIALHSAEKRKTIGKWLRHNKIGTDGSLA